MGIALYPHQKDAISKMKNGCILKGGVGSGKSLTSIAYFFFKNGGIYHKDTYLPIPDDGNIPDLIIITTARKRDTCDWDKELSAFLLSRDDDLNFYNNHVYVDSWNNIKKFESVKNAFFIFDEQRLVGRGVWVKTFLKIVKNNEWILLSATPGDTYSDYVPVLIANGFYKNKTDFERQHVVWRRFVDFPQIEKYICTAKIDRLIKEITVDMEDSRHTVQHHSYLVAEYDQTAYKDMQKNRFNYEKDQPIVNASELCYQFRKITNSHPSRISLIKDILKRHPKSIIFYNYDYELEILREAFKDYPFTEWNGHKHEKVLDEDEWLYLVQYTAGCEGWNCITTDTIIFYSQNYSYKVMAQAIGRIDRINTPFTDLYYYYIQSHSPIDRGISKALKSKQDFNEKMFIG